METITIDGLLRNDSDTIEKACSTAFVAIEDVLDLRPNGSIHPQCEKMTHARKCTNGIVMIYAPSIEIWTKDSFPQIYKYIVFFGQKSGAAVFFCKT